MVSMPFSDAFIESAYEELRSRVLGSVITPEDLTYDEARKAWNLTVDHYPAVIVFPQNAADVQEAVRFARDVDLKIAVQATGHGVSRLANGAMLINTSRMTGVRVDAATQTAWIAAGNKWGSVLEQAQQHGLAPLLGSSPDVGAVGYTLGGGMGWLARKYGLSIDSVNYFEVVTAEGDLVKASETENSDLFWALRGGGGSFGIITAMEVRLYPVTMVFGGNLLYPAQFAGEVYKRWREWIKTLPDELTTSIVLMNFPPFPQVPEFLRGQSFVMIRGLYAGSIEQGQALLQPWLDWKEPVANMWRPMPFSEVETVSNDPKDPSSGHVTGLWLREITDEAIDALIHYTLPQGGPPTITLSEIRFAGGAISRVNPEANAYGNRDANLILEIIAMVPSAEAYPAITKHISELKSELAPSSTGGVYINFLEGEEKWSRTRQAFSPENYRRLTALKAKYDPNNRFAFSFNIPPVS